MAQRNTKNAIRDVDDLIADLGDLALESIYDLTDKKNEKIRTLNIPNLVKNLVGVTLHLNGTDPSGNNVQYTADERRLISDFLDNFNNTVEYFMDFLDYDGDNQVKLVEFEKTKGKVEIGDDLNAFLDDMKDIGSSFKTDAKPEDKVFSALSKIFLYMLSDEYAESKEDIINFSTSVKVTFESLKALKDINHKRVFDSKVDDMISFIMMFCVLLIPIIDLVDRKLGDLNKADVQAKSQVEAADDADSAAGVDGAESEEGDEDEVEIVLPNNEVADAIKNYYGAHLDTVLGLVNQLTKKMIKAVQSSKWKKFKQKVCCCCVSGEASE
jgi:hypothetical protein